MLLRSGYIRVVTFLILLLLLVFFFFVLYFDFVVKIEMNSIYYDVSKVN